MAANRIEEGDEGYDFIASHIRSDGQVLYEDRLYKEVTDNKGIVFVAVGSQAPTLDNTYSSRSVPDQEAKPRARKR